MELSKSKTGVYTQLARRKMRERNGLFIVEGYKSIADTIDSFSVEAIIVAGGMAVPEQWREKAPVYEASAQQISKISSLSTATDMLAVYRIPEGFYDRLPAPDKSGLYLVLDGVQDPGNLGTIVRTAHWFGIERIYASRDTADIFNPKTVQSTMGSIGKVDIVYCDICDLIKNNPGLPVYGTLLNGKNIYETTLAGHGFIVMGNEGKGISEPIRDLVTSPLLIPPYDPENHSESLNVAVATAVVLSRFRERR